MVCGKCLSYYNLQTSSVPVYMTGNFIHSLFPFCLAHQLNCFSYHYHSDLSAGYDQKSQDGVCDDATKIMLVAIIFTTLTTSFRHPCCPISGFKHIHSCQETASNLVKAKQTNSQGAMKHKSETLEIRLAWIDFTFLKSRLKNNQSSIWSLSRFISQSKARVQFFYPNGKQQYTGGQMLFPIRKSGSALPLN